MHHIISDNWSFQLIQKDLFEIYRKLANSNLEIEEQTPTYRDYAQIMNSKDFSKERIFWKEYLKDIPETFDFRLKKSRPLNQSFNGKSLEINIDNELFRKVKKVADTHKTSTYQLLLSSWIFTLYTRFKQNDIVLGIPYANRPESFKKTVGNFINTFPYRTALKTDSSLVDIIQQVKKDFYKVMGHAEFPFTEIVKELKIERTLKYTPIYQVIFDYHDNHLLKSHNFEALQYKTLEKSIETTSTDIEMVVMRSEEKNTILLTYNTDIFSEQIPMELMQIYLETLESVSNNNIDLKNEYLIAESDSDYNFNF